VSADAVVEGIRRRTVLTSERHKPARELSGGFERRVLIAVGLRWRQRRPVSGAGRATRRTAR
jgi:energy-coupling factor transporter ATP-binding protein EcfA2